jgi:hypothetical protein
MADQTDDPIDDAFNALLATRHAFEDVPDIADVAMASLSLQASRDSGHADDVIDKACCSLAQQLLPKGSELKANPQLMGPLNGDQ